MAPRTPWLALAALPMLACSTSLRRGVTTTEAATQMEQVTRSASNELDPAVAPDGKTIAFEVADSLDAPPRVESMALKDVGTANAPRSAYGPTGTVGLDPTWMPDGSGLVFLSRSAGSYRLVQTSGPGADRTALLGDAGNPNLPAMWPAISPDGTQMVMSLPRLDVFRTGWSRDLWFDSALGVSDLFGTGVSVLGDGTDPAWSPGGRRLAFARRSGGHLHIFVANADGTDARAITEGPQDDRLPAWSPDGTRLAFCSVQRGDDGTTRSNLFVVGADGAGLQQLTEGDRLACRPDWARDGFIYFHADATDRFHVWRIRPVGAGR
jgi:Tol biopolymer transport system component